MGLWVLLASGWLAIAHAEGPTQVYFSCAPWDGSALGIEIRIPDLVLKATFWGRGFERLRGGAKKLEVDNDSSSSGTGQGWVCPTMRPDAKCRPERLLFEFTRLELKPGGKVSGRVGWKHGLRLPFEGVIDPNRKALCG